MAIESTVSVAAISVVAGFMGNVLIQWMRSGDRRHEAGRKFDLQLAEHRDKLMFDVLGAAREEIAAARKEASELRPLVIHLNHFDEALSHIESLINAQTEDENERARQAASDFLQRMNRFSKRAKRA